MAFLQGRNGYFRIGNKSFTPFTSSVEVDQTVGALDTSVYGVNFTQFITGLQDVKLAVTMLFDNGTAATDMDATLTDLLRVDNTRWDYMPEGSATGRMLLSGSGILTQYKIAGPAGGVVGVNIALQNSGTVTRSLAA